MECNHSNPLFLTVGWKGNQSSIQKKFHTKNSSIQKKIVFHTKIVPYKKQSFIQKNTIFFTFLYGTLRFLYGTLFVWKTLFFVWNFFCMENWSFFLYGTLFVWNYFLMENWSFFLYGKLFVLSISFFYWTSFHHSA